MDDFSPEQKAILSRFCTNVDKPTFGLVNLPQVVCGALFSRYSRSTKSARRVLLEEFIQNPEMKFEEIVGSAGGASASASSQLVATQKAEQFYDRVLVGYGDDSVAELGGAHLACEEVSNLATKFIQDARIGLSPLEKSTRYVYFHQKDKDNKYRYYCGKEIADDTKYLHTCDLLFDVYVKLQEPLAAYLKKKYSKPADGTTDRAYESTIKAKVCDLLRGLLPASTLTNTGLYGNGRAFEYLLTRMYSSDLPEINKLAGEMQEELAKAIPSFVKRANDKHGQATQSYWKECRKKSAEAAKAYAASASPVPVPEVELIEYDERAEPKICAAILFSSGGLDYESAKSRADSISDADRLSLLSSYVGERGNRRHKPGRAFEHAHYTFALCGNFGQYRDLQRHRMLTQERQLLTCDWGYDVPKELGEAGLAHEFEKAMGEAKSAYLSLRQSRGPALAQYSVPMAYRLRWYFHISLREAFHLIELRSMPQGHEDYRRVAVKMADEIARVHPRLASFMKFVNRENVALERLESEKKIDAKIKSMLERTNQMEDYINFFATGGKTGRALLQTIGNKLDYEVLDELFLNGYLALRRMQLPFDQGLSWKMLYEKSTQFVNEQIYVTAAGHSFLQQYQQKVEKVIFDSNIYDKIADGTLPIETLKASTEKGFAYYITHIQIDELNAIAEQEKRTRIDLFKTEIRPQLISTESFVWDVSKYDYSKWGDGKIFELLKKGNMKNTNDALIGETAIRQGMILVTEDNELRKNVIKLEGRAKTCEEFLESIHG